MYRFAVKKWCTVVTICIMYVKRSSITQSKEDLKRVETDKGEGYGDI
jgi:hypothetical protein